jgi:hypothetical protein
MLQVSEMSSEVVVPVSPEPKKNFMPVKCLLWRMCPIVSLREKDCVNKGTPSCKEFIRYVRDSNGVYSGDLR